MPRGVITSARECPWQSIIDSQIVMMNGFAVSVYCLVFQIRFFSLTCVIFTRIQVFPRLVLLFQVVNLMNLHAMYPGMCHVFHSIHVVLLTNVLTCFHYLL